MDSSAHQFWGSLIYNLQKYIRKKVGNKDDAQDILQEIIIKIYTNIDKVKDSNNINAWAYKIAKNTITDYYRNTKNTIELTDMADESINDSSDGPMNDEIVICLKAMIDDLPEKYKQAIKLTELGSLTQKELSRKLGLSLSGAKSRVQRGRAELKKMLTECCRLETDAYGNIVEYEHKNNNCRYC